MLAALSLAAAEPPRTDNCDTFDWLRTEAAAAAIALNESPQDAIAVALNATTNTDKAATLTPAILWDRRQYLDGPFLVRYLPPVHAILLRDGSFAAAFTNFVIW